MDLTELWILAAKNEKNYEQVKMIYNFQKNKFNLETNVKTIAFFNISEHQILFKLCSKNLQIFSDK